jgi:threonine/homoserine/homoserine lactone efflux protein
MNPEALVAFIALDLLLIVTPGADWAFAITAGVRRCAIGASIAGLAAGYAFQAALVTAGAGALIAEDRSAMDALTAGGAAYLVWLGIGALRRPTRLAAAEVDDAARSRPWLRGAAISALNPKGLLRFFAVLPQFVRADAPWAAPAQLAVLGAIHVAGCYAVYLTVALGARRVLASRPAIAQIVARVSGLAMLAIAVTLTLERALVA